MAGNNSTEAAIAIAALAIAIAALFTATLQILQAIFATARGLPNCSKEVMGDWSKGTKQRPKLLQLRLEVKFEAPIIFLAPPRNKNKPDPTSEMWCAEGTKESYEKNRIQWDTLPSESKVAEKVHTVNNELATWVYLLVAIERMEKDSKGWEMGKYQQEHGIPSNIQPNLPDPTLAVKIQAKQRSFDANPAIKKPYATTTISHLIELAAVLGLYWKVFNRDDNLYRAEGNGYSFTGSRIADFGIVFVFEKTGPTVFTERRVIPTSEVKELCFGRVPTLYRSKRNIDEDVEWQNQLMTSSGDDIKVEILQLGSRDEIAETLTQIGCNGKTTLYYKEKKKHRHLFPVTFEVIGMLARVLHIKDRCFRFLPNPTIFPWDRDSLSLLRLLGAFSELIKQDLACIDETVALVADEGVDESVIKDIKALTSFSHDLYSTFKSETNLSYRRMTALHEALGLADDIITARDQKVVLDVLRNHLQEVLAAINNSTTEKKPSQTIDNPTEKTDEISFGDLLGIPLEMREQRFMETYFGRILWRVVPINSSKKNKKDQEEVSRAIHADSTRRGSYLGNGQAHPRGALPSPTPDTSPTEAAKKFPKDDSIPTPGISKRGTWTHRTQTGLVEQPDWPATVRKPDEMERLTIWYTLVFRMICWLMLHDFDKKDVQVPKSELIGNRQPVFIL